VPDELEEKLTDALDVIYVTKHITGNTVSEKKLFLENNFKDSDFAHI